MKQITITVPDNCELKQDGNTYTIVEKEKKLTYEDILIELKPIINVKSSSTGLNFYATSHRMFHKINAINKLMNVAKYLNNGWQPDWHDYAKCKYYIYYANEYQKFIIKYNVSEQSNFVYFKSRELAQQAIEILGEETIKLALCADY